VSIDVTWLGHSTVVLDLDGVRLVTDPLLRRHAGILRRRGPAPRREAWAGADGVLLSHLHHDHADLASLRLLAGVPVFTAEENATWARRHGLVGQPIGPDRWTRIGRGEVEVKLAPAVHRGRPMPHRPNAAHGHLVRGPSGIVWVAGDTELFPDMAELPRLASGPIALAILPVGGWGPRLSSGHLGPEQAAVACRLTAARSAIPVHWKTLHLPAGQFWPRGWMDAAGAEFAAALSRESPGCRGIVLDLGESASIPGSA
jgi:L-ascorbate metabolism protein UlaG (beta-lactamase superfamily)